MESYKSIPKTLWHQHYKNVIEKKTDQLIMFKEIGLAERTFQLRLTQTQSMNLYVSSEVKAQ